MAIEVTLSGALEKEEDREKFTDLLQEVCKEQQLKIEDYDTNVIIDICPEGVVNCFYEKEFITLVSQTELAGPGFHAYVVELLEEISKRSQLELEILDPTQYAQQRDFETLRHRYFYQWLSDIKAYVHKHQDQNDLCICWHSDYHPENKEGMIITHMGYYGIENFINKETELLAKEFFLWNEKERDGEYYRNCAYHLLWKECFFSYSSMNDATDKIASTIISYLEAANERNPELELPMETYHELCTCIGHMPIQHSADCGSISGYRKSDIYYRFKNWYVKFPGCAEVFYDEPLDEISVMAPYQNADEPWKWMLKVSTAPHDQNTAVSMEKSMFLKEEINLDESRGTIQIFEFDEYCEISAYIYSETEMLCLRYILPDLKRREQCLKEIHAVIYQTVEQSHQLFTHA